MNVPALTTARLILRPLELADAGSIQKQFPQWEIVRFLVAEIPWPYPTDMQSTSRPHDCDIAKRRGKTQEESFSSMKNCDVTPNAPCFST